MNIYGCKSNKIRPSVVSHNDILRNYVFETCRIKLTMPRKYVCCMHSHRHNIINIFIYVCISIYTM